MTRIAWIAAGTCAGLLALVYVGTRRNEAPRSPAVQPEPIYEPTPLDVLTSTEPPEAERAREVLQPMPDGRASVAIDDDIVVRVVDAERKPVRGVEVVLGFGERGKRAEGWRVRMTDLEGLARFENARRKLHEGEIGFEGGSVGLFVNPAFLPSLKKYFTLDTLPNRPVGFRLPLAGTIAVHVRDARGRPVSDAIHVRLGMINPDETSRPALALERRSHLKNTRDGVASFLVPAGHEFEVVAQHSASFAKLESFVEGPAAHGETVAVELDFGHDHPIVKLLARDEAGEPVANDRITVFSPSGAFGSRSVRTRGDGSFLLFLDSAAREGVELQFQAPNQLMARRIFGPLPPGRSEGGEVVFRPSELVAAGRVVVAGGSPAPRSRVTWSTIEGEYLGSWGTGEEGRFEIRDEAAAGPFVLYAAGNDGQMSANIEVVRGATDVVLVLDSVGSLVGQLELGGAGGANGIRGLVLELSREDGSGKAIIDDLEGLRFSFRARRAGTYVLRVFSFEETIAEVSGLVIRPGEENLDPRLNPLDLAGRLELHCIEYGRHDKVVNGELRYRPAGAAEAAWQTVSLARRRTWVASLAPAVDVEVLPTHYLSQRLENVQGHAAITFQRKRRVRLRVHSAAPLPALPLLLEAHLQQRGSLVGSPQGASITSTRPEAVMSVSRTGPCEVSWTLHRVFAGEHETAEVDLGPPVVIDVRNVSEEQVFDVEIPAEELQRLLADPPF